MDLRVLRYFVAVAEERHVGRAAARLHMTQPPLSRAMKQLETELGALLLVRSAAGVALTGAGTVLLDEARILLGQAEQLRGRVSAAGGMAPLTVVVLADSAEQAGVGLAAAFRRRHPDVEVHVRESDFTEPSAGLRGGLVDVALTRAPFDETGIRTIVLRSDPVGVVLRADDPLATRAVLHLPQLADRRWFQLPAETDRLWRAYWRGLPVGDEPPEGPVVRTVHECLQAVLWTGTVGLAPLGHTPPRQRTVQVAADVDHQRQPPSARTRRHRSGRRSTNQHNGLLTRRAGPSTTLGLSTTDEHEEGPASTNGPTSVPPTDPTGAGCVSKPLAAPRGGSARNSR